MNPILIRTPTCPSAMGRRPLRYAVWLRVWSAATLALLALGAVPPVAPTSHGGGSPADEVLALIRQVEDDWPIGLKRDDRNRLVSLTLPLSMATDHNLELLSTVESLESLELGYNHWNSQPSASGVSSLRKAPRLTSLTILCAGKMPEAHLKSVAALPHLNSLSLVASYPPASEDYLTLTNLGGLRRLEVVGLPERFDKADAECISRLESLRVLKIQSQNATPVNCTPLLTMPRLSSLVVEGVTWRLEFSRPSK